LVPNADGTNKHGQGDELPRAGDPFAPGSMTDVVPAAIDETGKVSSAPEVLTDGAMKYTAKGSAAASLMVLLFAVAAMYWFPTGGVLVAALGSGLAVGGLFSDYRLPATCLLLVHLGLFFACYAASMGL
jgi:hypothetical protein